MNSTIRPHSSDASADSQRDNPRTGGAISASFLESLKDVVTDASRETIPVLMTELATIQTLLAARLLNATPQSGPDECLTLAELAERIKLGESTLRAIVSSGQLRQGEHYARKGRKLLFFWSAIQAWLRQTPEPSAPSTTVAPFHRRGRSHG